MPSLRVGKVDTARAAADIADIIRAQFPTAGVSTKVAGTPEQRSFGQAFGAEMAAYFKSSASTLFAVAADFNAPRPMRVVCQYTAIGRGANVISVHYLTRLRVLVPGPAVYRPGSFRSATLEADDRMRTPLAAAPQLAKQVAGFLSPKIAWGNAVYTIEPFVEIIPDGDGALLAAVSVPRGVWLALRGYTLDTPRFAELAVAIDDTLAGAPGIERSSTPNSPLPQFTT